MVKPLVICIMISQLLRTLLKCLVTSIGKLAVKSVAL